MKQGKKPSWNSNYHRISKPASSTFANRTGKDAGQLVEEAVDRMLEYDARFIEAVEEGRRGGVSCWSTMKL